MNRKPRYPANSPNTRRCLALLVMLSSLALPASAEELPLFDGKTFAGWTTLGGKPVAQGWEVADGMIHRKPTQQRAGHIITQREFGDFCLTFEWKIAPGGNSGLKYRVRTYSGNWRGCEYQILDDAGYHKPLPPRKCTGALYDLYAPSSDKNLREAGEFNSSKIVVQNDRVQHWLNGQLIVTAIVGDADWRRRVAESKFSDLEDFSVNQYGRIMLTDHGSEVWYRNLSLRSLPTRSRESTGPAAE